MRKTMCLQIDVSDKILLTTEELQALLSCGRHSAVKIGTNAQSRIDVGKRVLWNRKKVEAYLQNIAL